MTSFSQHCTPYTLVEALARQDFHVRKQKLVELNTYLIACLNGLSAFP
jgi:hypothetical protein